MPYTDSFLSLSRLPTLKITNGTGIIATAMNPSRLFPQPSPRASYIFGPASGRNAATMLRNTVKAANALAAYSANASMM